jgi:hypothetical protein
MLVTQLNRIRFLLMPAVLLVIFGCGREKTPQITAGIDACALCNMTIDKLNQACGFYQSGEFVVFDSPGCLIRKIEAMKRESGRLPSRIYFADFNTARLIPSDSTTFLLTDHLPTVMNAGVLCFSDHSAAKAMRKFPDEVVTDWAGFWTRRANPDRTVEVSVADGGFIPDVVLVNKGELVEWIVRGRELTGDLTFRLEGYDEIGEITVPETGDPVHFRMLAVRPGAGFPFVCTDSGKPLGMVKVAGAHTADEEAM